MTGGHGWYCKRCGQLHTVDRAWARGAGEDLPHLKLDPELAGEFDKRAAGVSADWLTPDDLKADLDNERR